MGILSIIKIQWDVIYQYVLKNIKLDDVVNFKKLTFEIYDMCKNAKNNNTCLGDCVHCEHISNKIKEYSKEKYHEISKEDS